MFGAAVVFEDRVDPVVGVLVAARTGNAVAPSENTPFGLSVVPCRPVIGCSTVGASVKKLLSPA